LHPSFAKNNLDYRIKHAMAKKRKPNSPAQLPQTDETWFFCLRDMPLDYEVHGLKPTILILLDLSHERILRLDVYDSPPDADLVGFQLSQAITEPVHDDISPHRPKEIQFENADLLEAVAPALDAIRVAASVAVAPALMDNLIAGLRETFSSAPVELPGLLSVPGTDPKMIARLFDAAAIFYRAAPWKRVTNDQTLAVTIDPPGQQLFVQVMGNGGMEFGLSLYTAWEDVVGMFKEADSPLDLVPETGMHGLTFESKDDLPSEDQEGLRKYGWKAAGRKAYPMPIIFTAEGEARRPDRQELLYYEALLRNLPGFIEHNLVPAGDGEYQATEAVIETQHADGPARLTIRYPAGELPLLYEEDEDEFWLDLDGPTLELPASLLAANEVADKAWREDEVEKRLRLARQALEISPDCTEAYLVLAYESDTFEATQDWLEKAVEAGERTLGQEFLAENAGDLWYWHQARPYLRAVDGLAESLAEQGRLEEALVKYRELLDLNDEDQQGARYNALRLLLQLKRDPEAVDLLAEYEEDDSVIWAYSRALIAFRSRGDTPQSRRALKKALKTNPHTPDYLAGAKPLPAEAPEVIGFGDENEAIEYALEHYPLWWATPGAVDWLKKHQ
jgi:tetratricopeptide (TPR) repeat protein